MTRRPEFTIIAGPNGAGKSKLGPFYSSVKAFDGDQLAMKLRKEHPDWKDSWIDGTVISTLMKEKDEAILLRKITPLKLISLQICQSILSKISKMPTIRFV